MSLLPPWTPFERGKLPQDPLGLTEAELGECWINSRYQVFKRVQKLKHGGILVHLSIKNRDKTSRHDWREFQRIKNELIGAEEEAMEIYPAESRLVDTSNQFHLWCILGSRVPVGFVDRCVSETSDMPNLVQRPWPADYRPKDLKPMRMADEPLVRCLLPDGAPDGKEVI
jgi:hypothetical protein